MRFIYPLGKSVLTKCRQSISGGGRWPSSHQCTRNVKVTEVIKGIGKVGFCKAHSTPEVEKRNAARDAKYEAESNARAARWKLDELEKDCFLAVFTLLEGDARRLGIHPLWRKVQKEGNR